MSLSAAEFRDFLRGKFTDSLRAAFKSCQILCEGDLQSFACYRISQFLRRAGKSRQEFHVLNKPFFKATKTYPDLLILKGSSPWAVIELKESKRLPEKTAVKEREKLWQARESCRELKRGYLVYVARYGQRRALKGPKGKNAYYFSEVPIVLWPSREKADKGWIEKFRRLSKNVAPIEI
jgi:hypothetical protein